MLGRRVLVTALLLIASPGLQAGLFDDLVNKVKKITQPATKNEPKAEQATHQTGPGLVPDKRSATQGENSPGIVSPTPAADSNVSAPTGPAPDGKADFVAPPLHRGLVEARSYPVGNMTQSIPLTTDELAEAANCQIAISNRDETRKRIEEKVRADFQKRPSGLAGVLASMVTPAPRPEWIARATKEEYAKALKALASNCAGLKLGEAFRSVADEMLTIHAELAALGRGMGVAVTGPALQIAAADIYADIEQYGRAEQLYLEVIGRADLNAVAAVALPSLADATGRLAQMHLQLNSPKQAADVARSFLIRHRAQLDQGMPLTGPIFKKMAIVMLAAGEHDEGIQLLEQVRSANKAVATSSNKNTQDFLAVKSMLLGAFRTGSEMAGELNRSNPAARLARSASRRPSLANESEFLILAKAYASRNRGEDLKSLYYGDFKTYLQAAKRGTEEMKAVGRPGSKPGAEAVQAIVNSVPVSEAFGFGRLFAQLGLTDDARNAYGDALEMSEALILQRWINFSVGDSDRTTFNLYKRAFLMYLDAALSGPNPAEQHVQKAFHQLLTFKGSLLDFENAMSTVLRGRSDERLQDSLLKAQALGRQINAVDRTAIFKSNDQSTIKQYVALLEQKAKADHEIRSQIRDDLTKILHARTGEEIAAQLRTALPKGAVYIDIVKIGDSKASWKDGNKTYVAIVAFSGSAELKLVRLGESKEIESLVARYQRAIRSDLELGQIPSERKLREIGGQLYDVIARPLALAAPGVTRWIVNPDGAIHLLPMEALVAPTGRYLIQDIEISYVSSGKDLTRVADSRREPGSALVVAAPTYDLKDGQSFDTDLSLTRGLLPNRMTSRPNFSNLDETKGEAIAVEKALARQKIKSNVLLGSAASKGRLGNSSASILHIATHGFFVGEDGFSSPLVSGQDMDGVEDRNFGSATNPMYRAGLALAGANNDADKGVLYAAEIAALDFSKTGVAVLSACDTGVGDLESGDSIFGLKRAFLIAGAGSLVTSLWPVASDETVELMTSFYDSMASAQDRSAALREGKLRFMKKSTNPYFWAPFVFTGSAS